MYIEFVFSSAMQLNFIENETLYQVKLFKVFFLHLQYKTDKIKTKNIQK